MDASLPRKPMRSHALLDLLAGLGAVACAVTVFVASALDMPEPVTAARAATAAAVRR